MSATPIHQSSAALFNRMERRQRRCSRRDSLLFFPGTAAFSGPALLAEIHRAAAAFSRCPLPPGARILVQISHPLALLITLPALWHQGYVPILTEATSSQADQARLLEHFAPDAFLQDSENAPPGSETLLLPPLPLLRFCPLTPPRRLRVPAETVLVRTTSGSTGTPRGVALSADQLLSDARNIVGSLRLSPSTRSLSAIPMSHAYGFSTLLVPFLFLGTPMVVLERPLPELFRKALGRGRAFFFPGIPLLFDLLLRSRLSSRFLARLNPCVSAGAPLPPETARRFQERTGNPLRNFYGASECGAIACDRSSSGTPLPGCVGTPLKGVRIALGSANHNHETRAASGGPGRAGRITVKGTAVGLGYVGAGTRLLRFHGRFQTFDLGRRDLSGRLFLHGRLDRMINVGGRKVFPEDVEQVLGSAPGVREVAVLGLSDPLRGEVVAAAIAGPNALEESRLLTFCRERLAAHRVPRRLLILPALPRTARGKVDMALLRSLLRARSVAPEP